MDKLEPILKQKFWILLGVGAITTIVGWWMATGSLAATITQRKTTLDGVEKVIPTSASPNASWAEGLARINADQQRLVDVARREMWNRQKAQFFWPATVDDFAQKLPYHGEFPPIATVLYRDNYMHDAEKVWKLARPFNRVDQTGTVLFDFQRIPHKIFGDLTPASNEIWDEQEDLWLLVPIMDAIRNINGGENGTRQDAVVHVIDKLLLLGGDREKLNVTTGSGMGGMGGMGSDSMGSAGVMSSSGGSGDAMSALGGFSGMGTRSGAGGIAVPTSAEFDPKEEYGDGGGSGGGGGGIGGYAAAMSMPMESSSGSADAGSMGGMGGMGGAATLTIRRYVDDAETLPYKTRAFYLSVIMDHRKVPTLLGALTANGDSAWPIEIGRVQIVRLNPDEGVSSGPGGGGLAGGYGSGMPSSSTYGGGGNPFGISSGFGGSGSYGSSGGFPEVSGGFPSAGDAGAVADSYTPPGFEAGSSTLGDGSSGIMGSRGARNAYASFEAAATDPFLARVALCGLIYIYKEVKEPEAPATPTEAASTAAEPLPDGTMPAEPTPEPSDAPVADPSVPQPAATEPETAAPVPAANNGP